MAALENVTILDGHDVAELTSTCVRYEDDTWIFTVFGITGLEPPHDLAGMLTFALEYTPPHLLDAVRAGEPLAPVVQYRMPSSQWRRYDKMRRFPDGPLVTVLHGCRVARPADPLVQPVVPLSGRARQSTTAAT